MCLTMMRALEAPEALAASTNSFSRRPRNSPRSRAGQLGPHQQPQGQRERPDAQVAEATAQHGGHQEHRHDDRDVGHAHEHRVHPAAVEAGDRADDGAHDRRDDPDDERDDQRDLRAAHRQGEVVDPDVVLPERVATPCQAVAVEDGDSGRGWGAPPSMTPPGLGERSDRAHQPGTGPYPIEVNAIRITNTRMIRPARAPRWRMKRRRTSWARGARDDVEALVLGAHRLLGDGRVVGVDRAGRGGLLAHRCLPGAACGAAASASSVRDALTRP